MSRRSSLPTHDKAHAYEVIAAAKATLRAGVAMWFFDVSVKSNHMVHNRLYEASRSGHFDVRYSTYEFGPQYSVVTRYDQEARVLALWLREHFPWEDQEE